MYGAAFYAGRFEGSLCAPVGRQWSPGGDLPVREALDGLGRKARDFLDKFHRNAFSQSIFGDFHPASFYAFFPFNYQLPFTEQHLDHIPVMAFVNIENPGCHFHVGRRFFDCPDHL
jgi:hypothetical protein